MADLKLYECTQDRVDVQKLEFDSTFGKDNSNAISETIYTRALAGLLRQSNLRSLCWKVYLGVLPLPKETTKSKQENRKLVADWVESLKKGREEYAACRESILVDPHQAHKEMDLTIDNPLSQNEQSPWIQFFENCELQQTIQQDLTRLCPEHEFFHKESVQRALLGILCVWSRKNPDTSYRQGMHELLAPIYLVLKRDAIPSKSTSTVDISNIGSELRSLLDESYVEHDAYLLFSSVMQKMKPWFEVHKPAPKGPQKDKSSTLAEELLQVDCTKPTIDPLDNNVDEEPKSSETDSQPIIKVCKSIQYSILSTRDPDLFNHLSTLGIEPQFYALRWLRLLFGREFHLEDVLVIWDAIFAADPSTEGPSLRFVVHMAVAMLIYIREQLLDRDDSDCLRRLMKYPPVEDVHLFVEKAIESQRAQGYIVPPRPIQPKPQAPIQAPQQKYERTQEQAITTPLSNSVGSSPNTNRFSLTKALQAINIVGTGRKISGDFLSIPKPQATQPPTHSSQPAILQSYTSNSNSTTTTSNNININNNNNNNVNSNSSNSAEDARSVLTQLRMGKKLDGIITSLQSELFEMGHPKRTFDVDGILLAIAQLKQVKDILLGQIDDNSEELNEHPRKQSSAVTMNSDIKIEEEYYPQQQQQQQTGSGNGLNNNADTGGSQD